MQDIGLLLLRVGTGAFMLFGHGWSKLMKFQSIAPHFPDPIGLGSTFSLGSAVFTEVFCSLLIIIGLKTKWFAVPLLITMLVAAGVIHAADPWAKKELALLYAIPLLTLIFTGPGKFSLDAIIGKK